MEAVISKATDGTIRGVEAKMFIKALKVSIENKDAITKAGLYLMFNGLSYEVQGDVILLVGDYGTHYLARLEDI